MTAGLSLGLDATITASDPLSRGRYGGDVFEKAYGDVRTGLGRLEIGQTDGAAYDLVGDRPQGGRPGFSLDDPQTTFFRDPSTGRAFTDIFTLRTEMGASSNYAKARLCQPGLVWGAAGFLLHALAKARMSCRFCMRARPCRAPGGYLGRRDLAIPTISGRSRSPPMAAARWDGPSINCPARKASAIWAWACALIIPSMTISVLSLGGAWRQSNAYAFQIARSFQASNDRGAAGQRQRNL